MDGDVLVGGASAIFLLIYLVQTARETFDILPRFVPATTLVVGLLLFLVADLLPDSQVEYYAKGLVAIAAASAAVRYVKNGTHDAERYPTRGSQEQHHVDQRSGYTIREKTTADRQG